MTGIGNANIWGGNVYCGTQVGNMMVSDVVLDTTGNVIVFEFSETNRYNCQIWFGGITINFGSAGTNPPNITYLGDGLRITSGDTNPAHVHTLLIYPK